MEPQRRSLEDWKQILGEAEARLEEAGYEVVARLDGEERTLVVAISERLHRSCRKGRVWKSKAMLTALKNVAYGLRRAQLRSRGGQDGIFLLDRDFVPANEMMKKVFDRFLDRPDPLVARLSRELDVNAQDFKAVRLVSHHMRLLGVLLEREADDWIVLVDYDDTKE